MTNEIKEILDNFKNYEERYKKCNETQFIIFYRDIHILLDYITNLQQELKEYKNTETYSKRFLYKANKDRLNANLDLVKENEKLKLEIERLNDVLIHKPDEKIMLKTNDGKELFIIQSERIDMQEELNKANMQLMAQLEDYKLRIEKAVELTQNLLNTENSDYYKIIFQKQLDTLNGKE